MSFLLRNARHEKLFDVRKRGGHNHPETGEACDGLCCGHLTIADFEAAAKDEAPALALTCLDCGTSVALSEGELAHEMERAAKALLNAADDLFRLAFAYQEGVQTAAAMATIRRAMELNGKNGDDPEREQMMLGYAVRSAVAEVRRQVADLHQRRYSNLG
jgi:hypothetical protein